MSREPGQQALTLSCRVRTEARPALLSELANAREPLEQALRRLPNLHFARLLLLPRADAHTELLLELCFDGMLAPLLAALWLSAGSALARLLRHCEAAEDLDDGAAFQRFAARYALRAEAGYAAHDRLGVAVIQSDAALEGLLQDELDRARPPEALAEHGPLEIASDLQARARAAPETWLGSDEHASARLRGGDRLAPIRGRVFDLLLASVLVLLLEFWQGLLALFGRAPALAVATEESAALRTPGAVAQLLPVKPGRLRLHLLRLLLWLTHGWFEQRAHADGNALSQVHGLRWLILPGPKLLLLAHSDVSPATLLARRGPWERRVSALIWRQTVGFPGSLGSALLGSRREAALLAWLGATLLSSELTYSAYPTLTVAQIERNRRVRELVSGKLDPERASELCALL